MNRFPWPRNLDRATVFTDRETPIFRAKNIAMARALIAAGADLYKKSDRGLTLLCRFVYCEKVDLVKLLMVLGIDPNKKILMV